MSSTKPPLHLQPTTLWEYPSQHYGKGMQGHRDYRGATPSYVIWNLLERYTRPGDLVVDPFCGSGTTLDVCADLDRKGRGFDLAPFRDDIEQADARELPLPDEVVDFVFMDPPYSDNLTYSDHPDCIGQLNATDPAYFEALDAAFAEAFRVLRDRRYMAVYICDYQQKRRGFVPIGTHCMALLMQYFKPIDHVCVVRHNKTLKQGQRRRGAVEDNTFLRGFNHLLICKKELPDG
ncbi:MAG: DNA methylase [Myxococcales bacterium]|nr:DNA methylase [Myxococcales bacterium]